jgi:fluoride exporter
VTIVLAVALGGLIGAPLRYHLDRAVQNRHGSVFPWGTLVVNLAGCFVLGILTTARSAHVLGTSASALLGVGLCGAFTTYSTFGYETLRLVEDGARLAAVANVVVSVFAGLGAALVGAAIGGVALSVH